MKVSANELLLSVVIPVYNGEKYIDELFGRFVGQAMDNIELVFIDDGSADNSYERLLQWKEKVDFTVSVYHQENMGVSVARNVGLSHARGSYLTFVDVDDGIAPNYIATLSAYAREGVDALVFNSMRIKAGDANLLTQTEAEGCRTLTKQEMLVEFWEDPTRFGVYNLLLRKELLVCNEIAFPVGYKYYEDYDFLLQLFAQTDRIVRLEQVLYYYILREGSAMGRFNADRINCLGLMKRRGEWLRDTAPEFASVFERWGTSRLYWSVLWQAALAMPSFGEFVKFATLTHAGSYLTKLAGYPDRLLQLSTWVFLRCRLAYYIAVRLVGRMKSKVDSVKLADIEAQLLENIAFY